MSTYTQASEVTSHSPPTPPHLTSPHPTSPPTSPPPSPHLPPHLTSPHLTAVRHLTHPQAKEDPACGQAVFAHDPRVGKTWQPWCDLHEVGAESSVEGSAERIAKVVSAERKAAPDEGAEAVNPSKTTDGKSRSKHPSSSRSKTDAESAESQAGARRREEGEYEAAPCTGLLAPRGQAAPTHPGAPP